MKQFQGIALLMCSLVLDIHLLHDSFKFFVHRYGHSMELKYGTDWYYLSFQKNYTLDRNIRMA